MPTCRSEVARRSAHALCSDESCEYEMKTLGAGIVLLRIGSGELTVSRITIRAAVRQKPQNQRREARLADNPPGGKGDHRAPAPSTVSPLASQEAFELSAPALNQK